MNEPMAGDAPEPSPPVAAFDKTAGTLLREAREAAGLHVGALAVSLKIPVKKLEALEADDLEQLPDAVFARALAATVCRTLKVDPAPVLARLPQVHTAPLKVGSQDTPIRLDRRGSGLHLPGLGGLPRWVLYVSGLLLGAAIVVSMVPSWRVAGDAALVAPQPGAAVGAEGGSPVPPMPAPTPDSGAAAAAAAGAVADGTGAAPAALAVASMTMPAVTQAATTEAAVVPAATSDGTALAVFTSREPTWVQVIDAAGTVQLRKTMAGGETASVQGSLPLSVVVGRANAIDVLVRGKPFDLAPVSKDNVARFQIK